MSSQKQPSKSIVSAGANAKKKYENGNVEFVCRSCKVTENIPKEVVEQFDMMDMGDPTDPPRFSCEKCGGRNASCVLYKPSWYHL